MSLLNMFKRTDINAGVDEFRNTQGAVLLDVRTKEEYNDGHIEGSINQLALHDFAIFKELYDFDLNTLDSIFHTAVGDQSAPDLVGTFLSFSNFAV